MHVCTQVVSDGHSPSFRGLHGQPTITDFFSLLVVEQGHKNEQTVSKDLPKI